MSRFHFAGRRDCRGTLAAAVLVTLVCCGWQRAQADEPSVLSPEKVAARIDAALAAENQGLELTAAAAVDDAGFLRRATVDLIGRIPTAEEYRKFFALPEGQRRAKLIERLIADARFTDRWTVFMADLLRIRSNADGGTQLLAYVHQALSENVPYDELCRRLISANGKPGATPEVGYILGDNADPMALAGTTSQVFMGIRIACAECHDHPFDVWTREQFYGFAAYFGRTRRIESELTGLVFTTETAQTAVLWPPADLARNGETRSPMTPSFPFATVAANEQPDFVARFEALREAKRQQAEKPRGASLDDLLAAADSRAQKAVNGQGRDFFDVASEANQERSKIDVKGDLYRTSELRIKLADLITSPRNQYFARSFTNRVWKEMVGRGFVEPVDDFSEANPPSHPETLDALAEEFVASGYDIRHLIASIANTQAYQRGRLVNVAPDVREAAEAAFVSSPVRRMIAETLYDSIVQAGHLFDYKYPAGANTKTVTQLVRVAIPREGTPEGNSSPEGASPQPLASIASATTPAMNKPMMVRGGYDLEAAIEVDFEAALNQPADAPKVDQMRIMSNEELEAMRMMEQRRTQNPRVRYVERYMEQTIDDNPKFVSATRMQTPAPPAHFLRVFGQPARVDLGDHRDESASMRQALMMLNGKLTHEAARVGDFEPIYPLLVGEKADVPAAIRLAYQEILTRVPTDEELAEAQEIIAAADTPRDGMADLRWVLFNCHEFRFLP